MDAAASARAWRPPPLIEAPWLRWAVYGGALLYAVLAFGTLEVNWLRAAEGIERGARFLGAFFPPDFISQWREIEEGLRETDFGAWEGLTFAEVRERFGSDLSAWLASPEAAPTGGGESFTEVAERVASLRSMQ